jgi:SAM-dependent methyltransferase
VLPFVPEGVGTLLDIGCGRGRTGAMLRRERGCRVTGLDLNPVALEAAAAVLDEVIAGDVETTDLGGPWDCVLALELLEHLVDPVPFLQRARAALGPGGRLVLSTPNVGHWSVARDLLAGRWDYLPVGLLCASHVRFWTRKTLEDVLEMAGCGRCTIQPQVAEGADEIADLAGRLDLDLESLRTTGFWVVVEA